MQAELNTWKAAATRNAEALTGLQRDPLAQPEFARAVVAAVGVRCATEVLAFAASMRSGGAVRQMSLGEIEAFDPAAWLAAVRAGGTANTLLDLLGSMYDRFSARGDDAAEHARARSLSLTLVLSTLCHAADSGWRSVLGWQAALVLKAMTGSAQALDYIAALVPGAPTDRQLAAFKEGVVTAVQSGGTHLAGNTDVCVAYDGVGARGEHRCRVAVAAAGGIRSAVTSFLVMHTVHSKAALMLQSFLAQAPSRYRPRSSLPDDFLVARSAPADGEERSETGVLATEASAQRASALTRVLRQCTQRGDGTWSDPVVEAAALAAAAPPPAASVEARPKLCRFCLAAHLANAQVCQFCSDRPKLPTMDEMRRAAEADAAAASKPVTVLIKRRRWLKVRDVSCCTFEGGVLKLRREYQEPVGADEPAEDDVTVTLIHEVLPVLPFEPNTDANIEAALRHIGKVCCVRGFVDDADVKREWVAVQCDQGALSRAVLDRPDSCFQRILCIPGTGHESTVYLRAVHALLNSLGFGAIIAEVYAASPGVVSYLQRGADVHQTRDWVLTVVLPALWSAAAREYVQSSGGIKDAAGFEVWMRSSAGVDPRFAFASDVLLHLLAGLRCVHVGIRSNDHVNFSAGRMELLIWMVVRGAINYVPLVIRDRADGEFLCTQEVRMWRHDTLSCANGEGGDYNLEEVHLTLQAHNPGAGRNDWYFVSVFYDTVRRARAALGAVLGVAVRYLSGSRPPLDLSADRAAVERILWRDRSLKPDTSGVAQFRDLAGKPLVGGVHDMRARGVEEVKIAAAAFKAGDKYVVRKALKLESKEVVEEPVVVHSELTVCKEESARLETELAASRARETALAAAVGAPPAQDAPAPAAS